MNIKNKKCCIVFFIIFLIISFFIISLFWLFSTKTKCVEDYSILDALIAQKTALGYKVTTEEMIDKYDMDFDGEITHTDAKIIQQMVLGLYDSYEVKDNNHKSIKYINE